MKTNIKNILKASLLAAFAFLSVGCNTDPEYFSTVAPETFFTSQETVWQRYMRPFTHWKWHFATNTHNAEVQEVTADGICLPTRNSDWYNSGTHQNEHHHVFDTSEGVFYSNFYGVGMGVALAYDALDDIENYVDFEALKFPEGTKELMMSQLNVLIAHLYMDGLDQFGGMNIYTREEAQAKIVKGRATDVETFEFIEKLLKDNIDNLPVKPSLGYKESNYMYKAFAATLLARLYFNAVPYTKGAKGEMYDKCAKICEDIISGVYGPYALDDVWYDTFNINNYTSKEMIYGIPSDPQYAGSDGSYWNRWLHYNHSQMMGGATYTRWNGYAIQPSYKPDGTQYTDADFKLGRPMAKMEDTDIRKQPYTYEGNGKFTGMFFMNQQVNHSSRAKADWVATGAREYKGGARIIRDENGKLIEDPEGQERIIYCIDAIARFSLGNRNKVDADKENAVLVYDWLEDGTPVGRKKVGEDADGKAKYEYFEIDKKDLAHLTSDINSAEEASGWRLVKVNPICDGLEYNGDTKTLRNPAMTPIARLTEIYYMLAECKYRLGEKQAAADLFNAVRKRNFVDGNDPNPVTAANIDKYRILDEWLIEFMGEKRRRTDLVRWDAYVTEDWWDHKATNNPNFNRFPIPDSSIASNNLLEQNPGY